MGTDDSLLEMNIQSEKKGVQNLQHTVVRQRKRSCQQETKIKWPESQKPREGNISRRE